MRFSLAVVIALLMGLVSAVAAAGETEKKTIYLVEKMTCGACITKISYGVASVDAGARVSGNPYEGVVTVVHGTEVSSETIGEAITESGYPARVMESMDAAPSAVATRGQRSSCGDIAKSWKTLYYNIKELLSPELATAQDK